MMFSRRQNNSPFNINVSQSIQKSEMLWVKSKSVMLKLKEEWVEQKERF